MCGIFGKIGSRSEEEILLARQCLKHRGPDGQQYEYYDDKVLLFHARLAIIDISGGAQPMSREGVSLIFNGEIYNYKELKEQFHIHTNTRADTEVILAMYQKFGMDMLSYLDGMFAMALYDHNKRKLFLIRDRAGKKPLYYGHGKEGFYFGSEQNLLYRLLQPEIRIGAITEYLKTGMIAGRETPYVGIYELEPATWICLDTDTSRVEKETTWWSVRPYYLQKKNISENDALEAIDETLFKAVKNRIESSDLEVGTFLSGGIDSGIITSMAAQIKPSLKTFTVKFEGGYDESVYAQQVAGQLGTEHTEISIGYETLADELEQIVSAYGEPFMDDSIIPSYFVSREARKHITVIINGDGGDELFGGYRRYVPFANGWTDSDFIKTASKIIFPVLPRPKDKMSLYQYAYRLARLNHYQGFHQYMSASTDLLHDQDCFIENHDSIPLKGQLDELFSSDFSSLDKMLIADFETILPYILLKKIDIATMQHSLEGRSPFLSKGILELAPTLPDSLKIKRKTTKYILRKLAEKYLPKENTALPKRGFEFPLHRLLTGRMKQLTESYLFHPEAIQHSVLKKNFVDDLYSGKIKMPEDRRNKIIFALLSLEIWHRSLKHSKKDITC